MTRVSHHDLASSGDARVGWLVPNRVIYIRAAGDIGPSVREWMNAQAIYLYHSCATPRIHLLIDTQGVTSQSPARRKDQPALWHPRRDWCLTIGAVRSSMLRTLINPLLRLIGMQVRDFGASQQALAFLQSIDSTLPDLQPYREAVER